MRCPDHTLAASVNVSARRKTPPTSVTGRILAIFRSKVPVGQNFTRSAENPPPVRDENGIAILCVVDVLLDPIQNDEKRFAFRARIKRAYKRF